MPVWAGVESRQAGHRPAQQFHTRWAQKEHRPFEALGLHCGDLNGVWAASQHLVQRAHVAKTIISDSGQGFTIAQPALRTHPIACSHATHAQYKQNDGSGVIRPCMARPNLTRKVSLPWGCMATAHEDVAEALPSSSRQAAPPVLTLLASPFTSFDPARTGPVELYQTKHWYIHFLQGQGPGSHHVWIKLCHRDDILMHQGRTENGLTAKTDWGRACPGNCIMKSAM